MEGTKTILNILKGVGLSILFTLICLVVFSILLVYTHISENLIPSVVIVVTGISILLGSSIGNRKMDKNGIINGAIIGIIYILCIYVISSLVNGGNFALNLQSIIMMTVGVICGIFGGIIGVNIKWK